MNRSTPIALTAAAMLCSGLLAAGWTMAQSGEGATPEAEAPGEQAEAPGEAPQPPAPLLTWAFDGESERASSTLPDSEAIDLVNRHGFIEGLPRGPRYMAFSGAGSPRCAVAIDSTAAVFNPSPGRVVVCTSTSMDLLDDHCQVRFSHPAEHAACLLDGEVLAVADGGHLLFLDNAGSTRATTSLRDASKLIASSDGGTLISASSSLRIFDPWGHQSARVELESERSARAIAGGPDRVYVVTVKESKEPSDTADQEELLAAYGLDGTMVWTEKLEPIGFDVAGLWAWPDGRGVVVGLTDKEIPGAGLNAHRLEARDSGGTVRWQLPMSESGDPTRIDVAFARGSGDIAVTINDQVGATPRAAILVITPDGHTRALLRVTAVVRDGGAQLSDRGRYLLINATDQGLLRVYKVP